jgi:hypothetical protein
MHTHLLTCRPHLSPNHSGDESYNEDENALAQGGHGASRLPRSLLPSARGRIMDTQLRMMVAVAENRVPHLLRYCSEEDAMVAFYQVFTWYVRSSSLLSSYFL